MIQTGGPVRSWELERFQERAEEVVLHDVAEWVLENLVKEI